MGLGTSSTYRNNSESTCKMNKVMKECLLFTKEHDKHYRYKHDETDMVSVNLSFKFYFIFKLIGPWKRFLKIVT